MATQPFQGRVRLLRETWEERRHLAALSTSHDLVSQVTLLLQVYAWVKEARDAILVVYGSGCPVTLSPEPSRRDPLPAFSFAVGRQGITFALEERQRGASASWHIAGCLTAGSPRTGPTAMAGPERRNGLWSRLRVEELLLSILSTYERSLEGERTARSG